MKNKRRFKRVISLTVFIVIAIVLTSHFRHQDTSEEIQQPVVTLYLHEYKKVIQLDLEEYVCGVVAAEMPASFEAEALKAQALCARTYACKKILENRPYPLGADLSDDITSCQAYVSWNQFLDLHPAQYKMLRTKIEQAVTSTRGEIIIYEETPIDALYYSTCGGHTESAFEVWGKDIAYLQSVTCNYCTASNYYETMQVISYQELNEASGCQEQSSTDIEISSRSSSGRAKEINLNDQEITASKFRQLFNLPSTHWEFIKDMAGLKIKSRGYGHGVGLCQYGANGMALDGKNYKEIIAYYYQDTKIYKLNYEDDR